jgi:integron integrase
MNLQEQLRRRVLSQGKSPATAKTYWYYCLEFCRWLRAQHGHWVHPAEVGRDAVQEWLSAMANDQHCAKNSQNTALQSVLYLYREILGQPIENVCAIRAKRPTHTREVLSVGDVALLFEQLDGEALLAASLMYGAGLRISDVLGLRLKDISFDRCQLSIKAGKGDKWRFTSFPDVIHERTRRQLESVTVLWRTDHDQNPNGVSLPGRLRCKMPRAANELRWYWLFPSPVLSRDPNGVLCRHHRHADHLSRQIKLAADRAGILTRVTSHVLRHSYATHAHEQGVPIRTLMALLGHNDIRTTEIYLHADQHQATAAHSPLAQLQVKPIPASQPALKLFIG